MKDVSFTDVLMQCAPTKRVPMIGALVAAALCTAIARAGEDLQFEEHTIVFEVDPIDPDSSYQVVRNIPQFDTMGGTRELLGVYESLETRISGHYTVHDNTSLTDTVGCDTRYGTTWWGEIDGEQFSPMHEDYDICDCTEAGGGSGAWLAPLTEGWDGEIDTGAQAQRLTTDPAKLAVLTGTGTVEMVGHFVIDPITKQPIPSPPAPPDSVFDPNLIDIELHATEMTMILTYVWVPVEPSCPADLVSSRTFQPPPDGVVDGADLAYLLGEWGRNPGSSADIVTSDTFQPPPDGRIDGADLAVLLGAWGACN